VRAVIGLLITGLIVVGLLGGCTTAGPDSSTPTATARCDEPELPPLQFGSHLLGDAEPPVPYSSSPPTSGWHASGAIPIGVGELTEPQQVSVLESGAVVISHGALPASDRATLAELATGTYEGRVAVTPYDDLTQDEVVLSGWGVMQRCASLDVDAIDTFIATYADEEPFVPGSDQTPRSDQAGRGGAS
jgi:hypothetical protein